MNQSKKVLVVNSTNPELNFLARALLVNDSLTSYVRPYANLGRPLERALARMPGFGEIYRKTLGRRAVPAPLDANSVQDVGLVENFLSAALQRLARETGIPHAEKAAVALRYRLLDRIQSVGAAKSMRQTEIVVANCGVGLRPFQQTTARKVLNHPFVHHEYFRKFLIEETAREPEFAGMLPSWDSVPPWLIPSYDRECELSDTILVGSSFARDTFISSGISAEKLHILPYGANISRFVPADQPSESSDSFRLAFVGQLGQRKGLSYLLKAYRQFKGAGTQLTLIGNLVGDTSPMQPYWEMIQWFPNMPQIQLAEVLRTSDVFVFPTLIEGMPLVVLEAMASGLPVITTPNGPGDIVRDGIDGFIVPPRDINAIVERLEILRADPQRRREMGANARKRALTYSWDAYEKGALEILGL